MADGWIALQCVALCVGGWLLVGLGMLVVCMRSAQISREQEQHEWYPDMGYGDE